jgi:hypothetical protein
MSDPIVEEFFITVMKKCNDFTVGPDSLRAAFIQTYVRFHNNTQTISALRGLTPVQRRNNYFTERNRKAS